MKHTMLLFATMLALYFCSGSSCSAATYYVATTGQDGASGTEAQPWRTVAHAAQQAQAGDMVCIAGGTYAGEHVVLANSGTADAPIVLKAWNGTPVLDGEDGEGFGLLLRGKSYVSIEGLTITRYKFGLYGGGDTHDIAVHNVTAYLNYHGICFEGGPHHIVITECTAYNNDMCNFLLAARTNDSIIEDCIAFNREELGNHADYCFGITRGSCRNIIRNCVAGGHPEDGHHWSGHGFALRQDSCYNRIMSCRSFYSGCEHFAAKEDSDYNEFVNCFGAGRNPAAYVMGFHVTGSHNQIRNGIACDVTEGIYVHWSKGEPSKRRANNNLFANNTIVNARDYGIIVTWTDADPTEPATTDNVFVNNIIVRSKCGVRLSGNTDAIRYNDLWENGINYTNCSAGTGDISADPLFADEAGHDFHLMSQVGRWNPAVGMWATDPATSPCIDAGDPAFPCGEEPQPNGGRINIGAYGGTSEASRSPGTGGRG